MLRRRFLALGLFALPAPALAQTGQRPSGMDRARMHDEVLSRSYDSLPADARQRVTDAFRAGTPDIGEDAIRQRWDSMAPNQRGEVLTMHRGAGPRSTQRGRGPGMQQGTRRPASPPSSPARPPG